VEKEKGVLIRRRLRTKSQVPVWCEVSVWSVDHERIRRALADRLRFVRTGDVGA
jgi:hypothetical protein